MALRILVQGLITDNTGEHVLSHVYGPSILSWMLQWVAHKADTCGAMRIMGVTRMNYS